MTKEQAQQHGKALIKQLKGKGWKLHIWENLGWHYKAEKDLGLALPEISHWNEPQRMTIAVYGNHYKGKVSYSCLLGCAGSGLGAFKINNQITYSPNVAVKRAVGSARSTVDALLSILEPAEAFLSGGK